MPLASAQLMVPPGGPGSIGAVKAGFGIQISNDGSISLAAGSVVTSVDVSGGSTGLVFSGGPVTSSGTLTMSGILNVNNGGTGSINFVRVLDKITFDGSSTAFTMRINGSEVAPSANAVLLIFIGGIVQVPGSAFTVGGTVINFSDPPPSDADFLGIILG